MRLPVAIVAAALLAAAAGMTREADATRERLPFHDVPFTPAGAVMTDVSGPQDIVVFDRGTGGPAPAVTPDLVSVDVTPAADGWNAVFRFAEPLPAAPSFPINVDLFVDADGDSTNNAPTGVFRAGADGAFVLLFGTRTSWHTMAWSYDPATGRWAERTTPVAFTVDERAVTLAIPSALLPVPPAHGATARAFALTSTGGVTAVDVAPGVGLPPVRGAQAEAMQQQHVGGVPPTTIVAAVLAALLGVSVFLWWKGFAR